MILFLFLLALKETKLTLGDDSFIKKEQENKQFCINIQLFWVYIWKEQASVPRDLG